MLMELVGGDGKRNVQKPSRFEKVGTLLEHK
jgi:hypothetical protein